MLLLVKVVVRQTNKRYSTTAAANIQMRVLWD
jgi:hypothetical protein